MTMTLHESTETIPDDAYVLTPCGPLGSRVNVSQDGIHVGVFAGPSTALEAVALRMEAESYYPDVAWVSDHGNWWLIDVDGNGIKTDD